ncbi:MAG: type II toxin-antitoxin system RelE/ParE family toxin [Gammaproteobacteria bacterium]|nr:type II toxin-antitoxin system RelE/ParE family toxin [Gammaproteobacteria bacterium]
MAKLSIAVRVTKFIAKLPPKHAKQIGDYIFSMIKTPLPHDCSPLIGYPPYFRGDVGEYRIIFKYEQEKDLVTIVLIGKRNDNDVYKRIKRTL